MFQTSCYCGGFEEPEGAFTFSWWDESRREWWFSISLEHVTRVAAGEPVFVELRSPP